MHNSFCFLTSIINAKVHIAPLDGFPGEPVRLFDKEPSHPLLKSLCFPDGVIRSLFESSFRLILPSPAARKSDRVFAASMILRLSSVMP